MIAQCTFRKIKLSRGLEVAQSEPMLERTTTGSIPTWRPRTRRGRWCEKGPWRTTSPSVFQVEG